MSDETPLRESTKKIIAESLARAKAEHESELVSSACSLCRIPGCEKPVFDLFPNKPSAGLCAGHGCEALAQFCESEWDGDSIQEISEGEQVGALIRDTSGIGTKYQANAEVLEPPED